MLPSMYTGVTGVKQHQSWLNVISNNVANINTTGFKRSFITFKDLFYQTHRAAAGPGPRRAGTNPKQTGQGVTNATVQVIHTQGRLKETDRNLDLGISGDGYFVLRDGVELFFSRVGHFGLDADGVLSDLSTGYSVQGYGVRLNPETGLNELDRESGLKDLVIKLGDILPAKQTESISLFGNLNPQQSLSLDATRIQFEAPVVSTDEVVTRSFGYDEKGVFVAQDENGFWRYRDGKLAPAPKEVRECLDTSRPFSDAGFDHTPDGSVVINGAKFNLADYTSVNEFISAINDSERANVTISYDATTDKWSITSDTPGATLHLSEVAEGVGFFTESNILTGDISPKRVRLDFTRILDPQSPNTLYYRFTPVDEETGEVLTSHVMSTGEVIDGSGTLDTSLRIRDAFGGNAPDGTISINGYTSRKLSTYTSLNELLDEINSSPDAGCQITYDPATDRFTIKNTHAGSELRLEETRVPDLVGALIEGRFLDEVNAFGWLYDGVLKGEVDGFMSAGQVVGGRVSGSVYGDMYNGTVEGDITGELHGWIDGEGMMSGTAIQFTGYILGSATTHTVGGVQQNAWIEGQVVGTSTGTMMGKFQGYVDTTNIDAAREAGFRVDSGFELVGDVYGFGVFDGEDVTGKIIGSCVGQVQGQIRGQVGQARPDDEVQTLGMDDFMGLGPDFQSLHEIGRVDGTIVGTACGTIHGLVTGHIWLYNPVTETLNYEGWVENADVHMSGIISGRIDGHVFGVSRGTITGFSQGHIHTNLYHMETAIITTQVQGDYIRGDMGGWFDITGRVHNGIGEPDDYIKALVNAEGRVCGTAAATVTGTINGSAYGKIYADNLEHARVVAQEFEGKGRVVANVRVSGEVEGSVVNTTGVGGGGMVGSLIHTLSGSNAQMHGVIDVEHGVIDCEAQSALIQGQISGTVDLGDTGGLAKGNLLGSLDAHLAKIDGDYTGEFHGFGLVEGEIDGVLAATSIEGTRTPPYAQFEGEVTGTIYEGAHIVGHLKGYIGTNYIDDDVDMVLDGANFEGEFSGRVWGSAPMGVVMRGKMKGKAEAYISGEVDAEKRSVPGFFERIHIRTGVKGPTSGIIELDSDPTSVNYGQKVVGLYIDGDANSPSARHRGNDVLDLTGERLTGEKVWRYTTQDGRGFFTLDFAGNDVQIIVPNGQVEGPEAISFSPNTIIDPEVDLISPTIKATDADDGVAIRNTQYLVEKSVVGFDAQGQKVNLGFRLERISESRWIFEVESERAPGELVAYGLLQFDENGEIDLERSLIFQSPADPDTFDEDGGEEGMPGSSIGFKGIYLDGLRISLDLQDLTQRGGVSEIATSQDGWEEGRLNSLSDVYVTDSGDIIGKYDNGIDQLLGKIQTASFLNKEGLKQVGDGMFRKTVNSCDPRIGDPGSEGRGSLEAFHLELSNVDLIEEFTNMIVAERSFQANVRAITTTDRIIMEVMRLRA